MVFDTPESQSAFAARFEAQKIAFGPIVFQCVRLARKKGLLDALAAGGDLERETLLERTGLSAYVLDVLLESCLSAGVVVRAGSAYALGKTGYCVLNDRMTAINFDFVHDVCYQGMFELEAALDEARPAGLKHLGDWQTIYHGLSVLPEVARRSWFDFDQYYSDTAFPAALKHVFARRPARLMDIGANTGKWAQLCMGHDSAVRLTLLDLPVQLDVVRRNLEAAGLLERADLYPIDLLDSGRVFPPGQDAVWMSQFLSCFSLAQIEGILARARDALSETGSVFVLDTFWDRQQHDIAAYCLVNTSPYFTALANGTSKMYRSDEYIECARRAGLELCEVVDGLGMCHSLLRFERRAV